MRILGVDPDLPLMVRARATLHHLGLSLSILALLQGRLTRRCRRMHWTALLGQVLALDSQRIFLGRSEPNPSRAQVRCASFTSIDETDEWLSLLPDWLPFHPHRWWIHTRNVATPMAYLSGRRFSAKENSLILSLRQVGSLAFLCDLRSFYREGTLRRGVRYDQLASVS